MLVAGAQAPAANQRKGQAGTENVFTGPADDTYNYYMYFPEQTRKPHGLEDCASCY